MSTIRVGAQVEAGKIAKQEADIQASQEELGAIQREGDRKSRLADALATQSVTASAGGIAAFEGSPLAILQEDIKREKVGTERDIFQARLKAITLRTRGKVAKRAGLLAGIATAAESIAGAGGAASRGGGGG